MMSILRQDVALKIKKTRRSGCTKMALIDTEDGDLKTEDVASQKNFVCTRHSKDVEYSRIK